MMIAKLRIAMSLAVDLVVVLKVAGNAPVGRSG